MPTTSSTTKQKRFEPYDYFWKSARFQEHADRPTDKQTDRQMDGDQVLYQNLLIRRLL